MNSLTSFRLDRLFEEQAARTPAAVALIDDGGAMTFGELDAAAERVAAAIQAGGVGDGACIGVYMDRSRRYVASVLGTLKTNAAVVPLPPSYPDARLRQILAFAQLDAVLVDSDASSDAPPHDRVIDVRVAHAAPFTRVADAARDPDRPAFVLSSSGSTGTPKMIMRSHRSFFHRLRWTWTTHPYAAGEIGCQKAHVTTTHAVYELFEPLLRGVPVVIISDAEAKALPSFWETIRRHAISRLLIVPSVLQASLDLPGFAPPDIKVLVLMGEYLHATLARRAVATFPAATRIYSIYGSTEASSTLVCDVRKAVEDEGELALGVPISADVQAHVLDENLAPVAAGASGMLYIGGSALFAGYFRDAALTAAAFATLAGGERIYRTNDRVRRAVDGALHYLGRTDGMVKVRGYRVDIQEVENAIAQGVDVRACAVVADDRDDETMLVGFVAPAGVDVAGVYRALRAALPDYMVPSRVIALDALPLTASGKIDRRMLRDTHAAGVAPAPSTQDPFRSETERQIADVWQAVLGHAAFGADSNFFEVGGTSLKTFAVTAKLLGAFGLTRAQLPDTTIYRLPTLDALARYIDDVREGRVKAPATKTSALVTLKAASDPTMAPVFLISSAGGTLGAYEKLVHTLATPREIVGVRDPYLWGERDPSAGFQSWASIYLDAIRTRQPNGPYYIVAYSSAGAFGYEIARRLQSLGEDVALLGLIDPLAIDSSEKRRFGHWAFNARYRRPIFARVLRFIRSLQRAVMPGKNTESFANDFAFTRDEFIALEAALRTDRKHILQLSALFELNTGLPLALTPAELDAIEPDRYLDALFAKMAAAIPDVDRETIERLVVQYQLQVRSQHRYRLQRYDGPTVLFDPAGPYHGLLALLFKPYVDRLEIHRVALAAPSARTNELGGRFSPSVRSHFLSMRDDTFVATVARELQRHL